MIFAVIDTNVIVAALMTKNHDSPTSRVMRAIFSGDVVPLFNGDILNEYRDVLSRDRRHLDQVQCANAISFIIDKGRNLQALSSSEDFPDPDDRVFYEVALAATGAHLVTGNLKHYPISPIVVTPAQFCELIGV